MNVACTILPSSLGVQRLRLRVYARYTAELTADAVALERSLDSVGRVEGRLEARVARGGGDPAVSPSGALVALSPPGPIGEPGRLVVWSTDTMSDAARDSAQRDRAERLSRTDPEDLPPVPQIPSGHSARYTLRDVNGASFREPRWFGDGERLLVIRSDYRPDGSLRPDVASAGCCCAWAVVGAALNAGRCS